MMVDVHLSDHRTVLRMATRGRLIELTRRDLTRIDAYGALRIWRDVGNGEGFRPIRMHYLARGAIAFVRHVEVSERNAFLEANDPHLLEHLLQKEHAATLSEGMEARRGAA